MLVGRSGSGKSTLLNLIGGIDVPTAGEILVDGLALARATESTRTLFRRRHVGFVFQFFNLIPTLTVGENLRLPLELNGRPRETARARVRSVLADVGLVDRESAFPEHLSGGEQQRVAVARALVHEPLLVLADEPTGNLDLDTGRRRARPARPPHPPGWPHDGDGDSQPGGSRARGPDLPPAGWASGRGAGRQLRDDPSARQRPPPPSAPLAGGPGGAGDRARRGGGRVGRPFERERPSRVRALRGRGGRARDAPGRRRPRWTRRAGVRPVVQGGRGLSAGAGGRGVGRRRGRTGPHTPVARHRSLQRGSVPPVSRARSGDGDAHARRRSSPSRARCCSAVRRRPSSACACRTPSSFGWRGARDQYGSSE